MKVTDKQYSMEKALIKVLDLMCDRSSGKRKMDNLLVVDGDEGYGKSTFAICCAYYVAQKLGREFNVDNVFFDVEKLTEFAAKTEEQIIIWDEAALAGLASEWRSKVQVKLTKLLMVARKKKHFWVFCIPKFFKLNEYIVVDRAIGLAHVYAREEKHLGRFVYFKKQAKEKLFYAWKRSRKRDYKKQKSIHGTFPNVLGKLIDEKAYDVKKDAAILSVLDVEVTTKDKEQRNSLIRVLIDKYGLNAPQLEALTEKYGLKVSETTIYRATVPKKELNPQLQPSI